MKKSILDLITSKRFIVLLSGTIALVAVRLNLGIADETAEKLAEQLTVLVATALGGYSISDAAKALTMPAGIDHKGRE